DYYCSSYATSSTYMF
nr:immunoglobulin light chain junction region [Macaca mulatta]MOY15387.1 immunoglobulin light chain junction region [Macaca mulatta]MOY15641.1 immunoglobulin light chain junction region [Macaca mulatta]MOY15984.1 immunoglobulin light chain junction region [Macaca mulatta]MOY16053.1 immunoglobulin light chain junction region [Macaca mulatta]